MAIGAGGDETDPAVSLPDGLEARGIRILCGDLQGHELPRRRLFALPESRLPADEVRLVEGDEAVEAAHARRIGPGELPRPDAEALLDAQGVEGVVAELRQPMIAARLQQALVE